MHPCGGSKSSEMTWPEAKSCQLFDHFQTSINKEGFAGESLFRPVTVQHVVKCSTPKAGRSKDIPEALL
jgi:hypothetical protein